MRIVTGMALSLALVSAACGGKSYSTAPPPGGSNPPPGGGAVPSTSPSITVQDNAFDPTSTTLPVGTTVTWTWTGYNTHNVTFDNGATSGDKTNGATYQRTFNTAGTYKYKCTIHGAAMSGQVTIQ